MNPAPDPTRDQDNDPLDAAFAAYLKSCDSGEFPDRKAFLAQFPELADQLLELIEAADMLGSVTGGEALAETKVLPRIPNDAETIDQGFMSAADGEGKLTLPLANRPAGDPGPTLPYQLGDYHLQSILGRGGMGVVYRAIQHPLQRVVAVKLIRSGMLASAAEVKRFFAEARAAAKLHHPNIVSVFHFGHRDGHHFFSMEYVSGSDLARKIDDASLTPQQAARYVRDVARAIDYAHRRGVLHRDLKPANVLIDENDCIHITDFGLAKQIDADSSLTGSGVAVGTPSYMAPEQASGHSDRSGAASDIYSLGAILFATTTGRPPFSGNTVMQTMMKVIHDEPPRLRSLLPDVPVDLETICMKCLEKEPHKRYASAAALADDLDRFLDDRPILARPRPPVLRALNWIEGVPLVAAVTGRRRLAEASPGHRRFQAAVLLLIVLLPMMLAAFVSIKHTQAQQMPERIELAGGLEGGVYSEFSQQLSQRLKHRAGVPVNVSPTGGSEDNRRRLINGQVHLAPLQASAINTSELSVAAPLFFEAVQVLVRDGAAIRNIEDLRGHPVAVGPEGSGSRLVAEYLFDSFSMDEQDVERRVIAWPDLEAHGDVDVAVICIGLRSRLVSGLLQRGWTLLPVDNAIEVSLQHPTLNPMTITPADFPAARLPPAGIATVGSTAFLAVRADAPDTLVTATLDALYEDPALFPGMITSRNAAEWQGLAFHRAARQYFAQRAE
ncbi:serine/threonine-protein kinase [Roseimaritima ulvae]|uniref:non-specific serine/threonine protein kinase n=1 Tax=Roseimaritima ulvae TaxID=980254 RepID=A0A5B9R1I8_9BACT|nr:serine/threonine-protein kinase [Roseimaritima ulvae]QEG40071.1 Serine/threonine-protein kinase PrkC [Roseimaritima ulvae]